MNVRTSRRFAAAGIAAGFAACVEGGEGTGSPVDPIILPPRLERTAIQPPALERQVLARIEVRDPTAVAAIQVDTYRQNDGVVDILWIVDSSGSMANERKRLVDNFDRFIGTLVQTNTRFQIGVTSTSLADPPATDPTPGGYQGTLRGTTKIITNATPNPRDVFKENTTFPPSRARWEQGLEAMRRALSEPLISNQNAGFLRSGAALAAIVVSDEDDDSFGGTAHFARFLRAAKGIGNENLTSFSAIVGDVPDGCTPPGEEGYYGSRADPAFRYIDVARRTGGVVGSICSRTFEQLLIQIAEALNTLRRVFPLSVTPDPATIAVRVNTTPIPESPVAGWVFRAEIRSVVFPGTYVPPPGSEVRIQYAIRK